MIFAARIALLTSALLLPLVGQSAVTAKVPTPADLLGFAPGTAGRLANYREIVEYDRSLAKASDRVRFEVVGKTAEGRDFSLLTISSPKNLANLDQIRRDNLRLADPRGLSHSESERIIREGKVIVLINESIHSTEVGPAQAGMVTAHFLATTKDPKWLKVLDDTVILLTPCHNPDGYEKTIAWWRTHKDDPKTRGARMPELYHRYIGHDNNRDWFMLTQAETRVTVTELHMKWRPQIVVDQHQMGATGARLFVPPYIDPYEPHVHPLLRKQLAKLGRFVVKRMTDDGLEGVLCNGIFDAWTPARAFMHYHGGVRVLTEAASANWADPREAKRLRDNAKEATPDHPAPWKPGTWQLRNIVHYTSQAALCAVQYGSNERSKWLRNFLTIHKDQVHGKFGSPGGYLVRVAPERRLMERKLLDLLTLGGVEVRRLSKEVVIPGESEAVPAGTLWIANRQPCFAFAAALLENAPYPIIRPEPGKPIRRPYDMTCHALNLLMDFKLWKLKKEVKLPTGDLIPSEQTVRQYPPAQQYRGNLVISPSSEGALVDILRIMNQGVSIERLHEPFRGMPKGAFLVKAQSGVALHHCSPLQLSPDTQLPRGKPLRARRIGIYDDWNASMDAGWTRFFFDHFKIPFTQLRPDDVRLGELHKSIDVLVIASVTRRSLVDGPRDRKMPEKYRRGLGEEGLAAIDQFVRRGGTLVTMDASTALPLAQFDLPVQRIGRQNVSRPKKPSGAKGEDGAAKPKQKAPYLPGTMLWTSIDQDHPLGFGTNPQTPVFVTGARAFEARASEANTTASFPVRFAPTGPLIAGGFGEHTSSLRGRGAVVHAQVEAGHIVLFAFRPQFRCQTWSTYRLFLNSLLIGAEFPE